MNYTQAIKLLAPFHNAQLIWQVPNSKPHAPTGQITTGNREFPLLPVNDGIVVADDVFAVLEQYESEAAYRQSIVNHFGLGVSPQFLAHSH